MASNPYLFIPKVEEVVEPAKKSVVRSLAGRKAEPPRNNYGSIQRGFRWDPFRFCEEILGIRPWSRQREILETLAGHRRVAVRSCNGAGKTFTAALAVLWWMYCYDDAICITTAPSERQVRELLWREIRRIYIQKGRGLDGKLGGKLTRTRLDFSPTRYAYGFSTNTIERFQGFHSGNVLVIMDEASGIHEDIFDAVQGILTSKNSKLLMIGNPNSLAGTFYDAFNKNRKRHSTIAISAFDIPKFVERGLTAENIKDAEYNPDENTAVEDEESPAGEYNPLGLSTPEWAIDTFNLYGPESALYQIRVLGQFPESANDTLIPLKNIEASVNRKLDDVKGQRRVMGVDVARFGNDKTVFVVRQGGEMLALFEYSRADTVTTTGRILHVARQMNVKQVNVDGIGIGAGVVDNLKSESSLKVFEFNASQRAAKSEQYMNLRAEAFDGIRKRFEEGDISIQNEPEVISELASLTYSFNARGQMRIQSKDDIRRQGKASPDHADAFVMAYSDTVVKKPWQGAMVASEKGWARFRQAQREDRRFREY